MKFPTNTQCYEVKRTTKTLQYLIRDLRQGDYFGHEEILSRKDRRQTRAKCLTNVKLLYINKVDFLNQFWESTLKYMKELHCHMIELDFIVSNINKYYNMRKLQSQALLDATKINPGILQEGEGRGMSNDTTNKEGLKLAKLKPWLCNAKNNITHNKLIIRELSKVKVLEIQKEKMLK